MVRQKHSPVNFQKRPHHSMGQEGAAMAEEKKRKPLKEWLKKTWAEYLENCGRELKELKEKRFFRRYLSIGPKLLGHTVIYLLFFFVILGSSFMGGIEENDRDVD